MSSPVQPHRLQPTRLRRPWDSPGKNTGVGCHFLPQCMKGKSESEVGQSCLTLHDPMDCSLPGPSVHGGNFPGKSTGVGCHCLLQPKEERGRNRSLDGPRFCAPISLKVRGLTEVEDIRRGGKNTQKNYTEKIFTTQIITMV